MQESHEKRYGKTACKRAFCRNSQAGSALAGWDEAKYVSYCHVGFTKVKRYRRQDAFLTAAELCRGFFQKTK